MYLACTCPWPLHLYYSYVPRGGCCLCSASISLTSLRALSRPHYQQVYGIMLQPYTLSCYRFVCEHLKQYIVYEDVISAAHWGYHNTQDAPKVFFITLYQHKACKVSYTSALCLLSTGNSSAALLIPSRLRFKLFC